MWSYNMHSSTHMREVCDPICITSHLALATCILIRIRTRIKLYLMYRILAKFFKRKQQSELIECAEWRTAEMKLQLSS